MTAFFSLILTVVLGFSTAVRAEKSTTETYRLRVVTTTTLLETALRELLENACEVKSLLPGGSCPGHFDLGPEDLKGLSQADFFVRHDFQADLDRVVVRAGFNTDRIISANSLPAFTIPSNYLTLCRQLAYELELRRPELGSVLAQALINLESRVEKVTAEVEAKMASLRGKRVVAANYQKDFCEWAGLNVVSTYRADVDESTWHLQRAVHQAQVGRAEAVVGNKQWGTRHLRALTEALHLPGIMLSNFPASGDAGSYWELLESNISALLEGLRGNHH